MICTIDLHNHSCLSPCGSLEMSPSAMVKRAKHLGISLLGLSDHNSTRNLPAFDVCCTNQGIFPLCGIEVTTREEVHVTCYFETLKTAQHFGRFIESLLPDIPNSPDLLGDQVYVDSREHILGEVEKSLGQAADITFEQLLEEVHGLNGLFIPAHIDRPYFSVSSQLGFLPDLPYDAVESIRVPSAIDTYQNNVITNSDAHYLDGMGRRSWQIEISEYSFTAISAALESGNFRISQ